MVLRWLKQLLGRPDQRHSTGKGVVEAVEELVPDTGDDDLDRQAALAEAVKAKAAFAAMLTEDASDRELYEKFRDEALGILRTINDEFYAGFARHQIIRLCLEAGEPERAAALFAEIEDEFILDEIHEEFPDLKPSPLHR